MAANAQDDDWLTTASHDQTQTQSCFKSGGLPTPQVYSHHHYTKKNHIIDYARYTDDILIIYNNDITNIVNIQFTVEKEIQNKLNYLHLTITNLRNTLAFNIFRKPTSTALIIYNDSCQPQEHKNDAISNLKNRMNIYPITDTNKNHEV